MTRADAELAESDAHETAEQIAQRLVHERQRIDRARASAAAGRVVSLADMNAWAESLDRDEVLPLPRATP